MIVSPWSLATVVTLASMAATPTWAFCPSRGTTATSSTLSTRSTFTTTKTTTTKTTTTLSLTSDEILARSRQAAGKSEMEESSSLPMMVFEEDILQDMQSALLLLEKRVQEGPGSLAVTEWSDLTAQLNRIVAEMHQNPHRRHVKPERQQQEQQQQQVTTSTPGATATAVNPGDVPVATTATTTKATPAAAVPTASGPSRVASSTSRNDNNKNDDDEGPAYDGLGGMGQPRGTVNTYIIEGMDEMTSEEYRLALQQSIIDTQRQRRANGRVGNRGSLDYLHSLSPGMNDSQKRTDSSSTVEPDESRPKWQSGWS